MNLPIINLIQNTPEWHKWRSEGIGASEIAALYGQHPYLTEYDLWLQKTGQFTLDILSGSKAASHGTEQEPIAFACLKNEHQLHDLQSICIEHPKLKHLRASLDGYSEDGKLIIEIKSPFGEKNRSITKYEDIPEYWIYQMQFQQAIARQYDTKIKSHLFLWKGRGEVNLLFPLQTDLDLQADMIQKADQWWQHHVVMGNPVKPDTIEITQKDLLDKIDLYDEYNRAAKDIEHQKKHLKREIEAYLDGKSNYCTYTHQIIRMAARSSYDYNAMKRDGIDLSKYKVQKEEATYIIKRRKH